MPELPEVETMRRGILPIVGATIVDVSRTPCQKRRIAIKPRIDHLNRRVAGQRITAVERLGKRVVVRLKSDDRVIFEPRMTGLILIENPPSREHLRICMRLKHAPVNRLLFWDRRGLGRVSLWSPDEYRRKISDGSLGPDALDVGADDFGIRFRSSRREVKVALLDQSLIAGIGNLYASEILHSAGVHPQARCNLIRRKTWHRIYASMREVLGLAIRYEGSTLSDGTYRNALNDPGSFQNQHRVYDRAGDVCPTCRQKAICRIVQAQRSTFFCPRCQKKT